MYKYANQLLQGVLNGFFSKLADVHEYNTINASTQHVYVCFHRTTRGQNKNQVTVVLISGIMFLIMLTQTVQLANSKSVSRDCFQTSTYVHDSATFWCIYASVVIMLNLYNDVYTCICLCICVLLEVHIFASMCTQGRALNYEFQHSALFLYCTPKTICLVYNWYWGTYDIMASRPVCQVLYISCMIVLLLALFYHNFLYDFYATWQKRLFHGHYHCISWISPPECTNHSHIEGLVQDCSNSIANTLGLLQACTKISIWCVMGKRDFTRFEFKMSFWGISHYNDVIMTTMASQITSLTVVYSTVYSDADQRKHQSSASLALVWGIHRDRWIPRTKGQLRGKCFHLMTSSCCITAAPRPPFWTNYNSSMDK